MPSKVKAMLKLLHKKHNLDGTHLLKRPRKNIQLFKVISGQTKGAGFSIIELLLASFIALVAVNASAQLINNISTSGLNRRAEATSAIEVVISNDLAWFRQYAKLWKLSEGPYTSLQTTVAKTTYKQLNPGDLFNKYNPKKGSSEGLCGTPAFANAFQKDAASLKINFDSITLPPYAIPNGDSMTSLKLPSSASGYKLERKIESGKGSLIISYTLTNPAFDNPLVFRRFSSIYLPAAGWC
jgi:type II secretory pathway pseudopilin PulG